MMGMKTVIYSEPKFIKLPIPILSQISITLKHACSPCHSSQYCSCLRVQLKKMETTGLTVQSRKSHFLCRNLVIAEVDLRVVQLYKMWKKTSGSLSDLPLLGWEESLFLCFCCSITCSSLNQYRGSACKSLLYSFSVVLLC